MNTKNLLLLAAAASCSALTAFAADAPTTTVLWDFATAENPVSVTPEASNPFGVTGTATIVPGIGAEGHSAGVFLNNQLYGTATGVWDLLNGSVTIDLVDQLAATEGGLLDYTVVVRHYISVTPIRNFPYPASVNFSIPGGTLVSQVVQETASNVEGTATGSWVLSTYSWNQLAVPGLVSITLSTEPSRGLLLDSLSFSVVGDLVPIPEPSVAQLGALAALMLGFTLRRRQVAG